MGYAFHITRAANFWESERDPIGQNEWEDVAASQVSLREDSYVEWADIGRQKIFTIDGEEVSFSWRRGEIVVEGVYTDVVKSTAGELARLLEARVQGDDED